LEHPIGGNWWTRCRRQERRKEPLFVPDASILSAATAVRCWHMEVTTWKARSGRFLPSLLLVTPDLHISCFCSSFLPPFPSLFFFLPPHSRPSSIHFSRSLSCPHSFLSNFCVFDRQFSLLSRQRRPLELHKSIRPPALVQRLEFAGQIPPLQQHHRLSLTGDWTHSLSAKQHSAKTTAVTSTDSAFSALNII
jgi:hypothetical protein